VKITRAEPGGMHGEGLWRPVEEGLRPTYENDAFRRYLEGRYIGGGKA
jgi:nitrate reductase alpha subunit